MGLDPRFAFWRLPRRVERLAIHLLVVDQELAETRKQVAQLGQTLGGLVAEKRVARDAELNAGFLGFTEKLGAEDENGVWRYSEEWRQAEAERLSALDAEEDAAGIIRTSEPVGGFHAITPLGEEAHGA
jgi:hypothetical protein